MQLDRTYQNLWLIGNDNRLFPQIDGVENIEFDQKNSIGFGETNGQKKARYYPSQKSTSTANCYCYFQPTSYR